MKTQTVEFAVTHNKGTITRIGRASILQPMTSCKGSSIKWYQDKPRKERR